MTLYTPNDATPQEKSAPIHANTPSDPSNPLESPWLNEAEAAIYLRVTLSALTWYRRQHALPHYRLGGSRKGQLIFHRDELDAWVRQQPLPPAKEDRRESPR